MRPVATEFRRNETVKALDDLPGVPQGTQGRVLLVDGFAWTRYRVAFENGRDLGSIDGSHLSRAKEYARALGLREEQAAQAEAETQEAEVEGDEAASAESSGGDKVVNGVTVPAHLLERSRRRREQLGVG